MVSNAGRVGLLVVSLCVVLGSAELVLRSRSKPNDAVLRDGVLKYRFNPYMRDRELAYALRPSWETIHASEDFSVRVRTNRLGLRGDAVESRADAVRILFAGDSYAFGFGVEDHESFPERIGALLESSLERSVAVLNAGVPGWASDQHLLYLRKRGLRLEPDLLIVEIMQNDVSDLAWHTLSLDDDGLPVAIESRRHAIDHHGRLRWLDGAQGLAFPIPDNEWLAAHSQLYHWVRFRLARLWLARVERQPEPQGSPAPDPAIPMAELSAQQIQRGIASSPAFRLRYHRHLIAAIAGDAAAREIPVRFVLIGHGGPEYALMRADCAAMPECFDTTSLFDDPEQTHLSFPNDGHWTPAGHDRAARAIVAWLLADPPSADLRARASAAPPQGPAPSDVAR